jgi:orotate phosphoribosyltransferase
MTFDQNTSVTQPWAQRKKILGRQLLEILYKERLLKTWLRDKPEGWELVSGYWSPFYFQLRNVPSRPSLFSMICNALAELIENEARDINRLIGLATTGIPIAAAMGLIMGKPMGYTRKLLGVRTVEDLDRLSGDYGAHALIEGDLAAGDRIALVDDVAARFTSKEFAMRQIAIEAEHRGLADVEVGSITVLIDREQGAEEAAKAWGVTVHSLIRLRSEGLNWLKGMAADRELEIINSYLEDQDLFQSPALQKELKGEGVDYIASEKTAEINESANR